MGDGTIFGTGACIGGIVGLLFGLFLAIYGAEQRVKELQAQAHACEESQISSSAHKRQK